MKWNHLSVDGEMGAETGVQCAGCDTTVHDLIFSPKDWGTSEAQQLHQMLSAEKQKLDPNTIVFCENCKHGFEKTHSLPDTGDEWPEFIGGCH